MHRMFMLSTFVLVFLNVWSLVLTTPISTTPQSKNPSYQQAFRQAERVLHRYYYLINSDTDYLVHGMLNALLNNPISFPTIPHRAMRIALKNVEEKLGREQVEILTKPLLLAIEANSLSKPNPISPVKLNDKTKEEIEQALDKFLDETGFDRRL